MTLLRTVLPWCIGLTCLALAGVASAAEADLAGVWRFKGDRFEEIWTFKHEKGAWKVTGVFRKDGKELGSCHGDQIEFAKDVLKFRRVFDKKPADDLKDNFPCSFTLKDGKGELAVGTGKTATRKAMERMDSKEPGPSDKPSTDKPRTDKPSSDKPPSDKPPSDKPPTDKPRTDKPPPDKPSDMAKPFTEVASYKTTNIGSYGVALAPDAKQLAAVLGKPGLLEVGIVDVESKKIVQRPFKSEMGITHLAWSADGKRLAMLVLGETKKDGRKSQVLIYETAKWEQLAAFEAPGFPSTLALSADGGTVATSTDLNPTEVKVWDTVKKKEILSLDHKGTWMQLALSADGKTLALNPYAGGLSVLDLPKTKPRITIKGNPAKMIMSGDAKLILGTNDAGGSAPFTLTIWEVRSGKTLKEVKGGKWRPDSLVLLDNDRHVAVAGASGEVHIYEVSSGKLAHSFTVRKTGGLSNMTFLLASQDSSRLLTYTSDRVVRLWTLPFGEKK